MSTVTACEQKKIFKNNVSSTAQLFEDGFNYITHIKILLAILFTFFSVLDVCLSHRKGLFGAFRKIPN